MKTLNITDSKMTIKTSVELTVNTVFREVSENENYDLVITEQATDAYWKSTNKQLGEIDLEVNDCWLTKDNVLTNQSGFIAIIKKADTVKTTTIYRAGDYTNNTGDFLGFFNNFEEAKNELKFSDEAEIGDGTFSQITEFTVLTSEFEKGDIEDKDFMMEIWGEGEIVKDYFFTK